MRYLGLDVHSATTVWCLLDDSGEVVGKGKLATTAPALKKLLARLGTEDTLLVGQEVGTMSYFVHDVVTSADVKSVSFNAHQLRMIASSRKKTDKRDAYWLAKVLQTGMMPHPVYIPTGEVRCLRQLLSQRESLKREQRRWLVRAKSSIRAAGLSVPRHRSIGRLQAALADTSDGIDGHLAVTLQRFQRMHDAASGELVQLERTIVQRARGIEAIKRLQSIPAVGPWVAVTLYAWVGDISRFPNARKLTAYAGLVPSIWQSGKATRLGGITKQGSPRCVVFWRRPVMCSYALSLSRGRAA